VGAASGYDIGGLGMLTGDEIAGLLEPYVGAPGVVGVNWPELYEQLAAYLKLILKWNARMNLTAVREPVQIVRRHFGESLFLGAHVGTCKTLLDFGSGAGLPGLPVQLLRPDIRVTLAESQGKKAAFLREVVRDLGLCSEVWSGRVESMPADQSFDVVAMRAVEKMELAVQQGAARARKRLLILGTAGGAVYPMAGAGFGSVEAVALPESSEGILLVAQR
jgi:16S rRNA (guanine527-N7)-methyltransferase